MISNFCGEQSSFAQESLIHSSDPFGAVLVYEGGIVHEIIDQSVTLSDPTVHAELHLIRVYCQNTKQFDLTGYMFYISTESGVMGMGVIHWR